MLTVIDHTEPNWSARYGRTGRENGAATYSREIVQHQIPLWREFTERSGEDITVSTCPLLHGVADSGTGDLAVQYLHTYRYQDPLRDAISVMEGLRSRYVDVWFVTAYRPLQDLLQAYGLTAVHLPMTVDQAAIRAKAGPRNPEVYPDRVAWYGNLTRDKHQVYGVLRKKLSGHGTHLDIISGPQEETFPRLQQYGVGVGVGRSALEMMTLGLRVMIGGNKFGGLITNEDEFLVQRSVNFNGRVVTYDRDPETCIQGVDLSIWAPDDLIDSSAATNILCGTLGLEPRTLGATT